jgi:hypothetical protein
MHTLENKIPPPIIVALLGGLMWAGSVFAPSLNTAFSARVTGGFSLAGALSFRKAKTTVKEWERNTDIAYAFQDGALKNLGVKWRNATLRSSNFGNDVDENRLIVSYTLPLL